MASWIPASDLFQGGTQQVKKLVGARVRTRRPLLDARLYEPIDHAQETTEVRRHTEGYIANPLGPEILIALSTHGIHAPPSLKALQRSGRVQVLVINAPTFKKQFEIEQA